MTSFLSAIFNTPRSSNGSGYWPFKPAMQGSNPARGARSIERRNTRPVGETDHHATLRTSSSRFESWAGYLTRDEGEMAPRLVWDQETAGSSPAIPTSFIALYLFWWRGAG